MTVLKAFSDRPLIGARLFDDDVRCVNRRYRGTYSDGVTHKLPAAPARTANTNPAHALVRDLSTSTNPLSSSQLTANYKVDLSILFDGGCHSIFDLVRLTNIGGSWQALTTSHVAEVLR
jgi:hypothetical protein